MYMATYLEACFHTLILIVITISRFCLLTKKIFVLNWCQKYNYRTSRMMLHASASVHKTLNFL